MTHLLKNSVFRDNIRENRLITVPGKVRKIIDTPIFQRLRRVRQMGLASLVFPTAEHSRFSHSVGVFATAQEAFRALQDRAAALTLDVPALKFDAHAERAFCAAAMCHDLGHTAYSHVLEKLLLPGNLVRHEDCSVQLLIRNNELRDTVESYTRDIDAVILFIDRERKHPNLALDTLVSGPFDVDRADYLLRDSQAAGVHYGRYDLSWLLHSALVDVNRLHQPMLTLDGPRGLDALRQFISGRHYMYRNIYLHPTIRAAQLLLGKIFQRVAELVTEDGSVDGRLVDLSPKGLQGLISGQTITYEDFEITTDVEIDYFVRLAANTSKDTVLSALCAKYQCREFGKCVLDSGKLHESLEKTHGIVEVAPAQLQLLDGGHRSDADILAESKEAVAKEMNRKGEDPRFAEYLVYYERYRERRPSLKDIRLRFGTKVVNLYNVQNRPAGYDPFRLSESFEIYRLYAPLPYVETVRGVINGGAADGTES